MKRTAKATCAAAVTAALMAVAPAATGVSIEQGFPGLNGPRGVAAGPHGKLFVAQADGVVGRVIRSGPDKGKVRRLTKVPKQFLAPAISMGKDRRIWILTVGADSVTPGAGTLYRYTPGGHRKMVLNIQKWQKRHPDPYDTEKRPRESNPYGVAALDDGTALVADAANNSLVRVWPNGRAMTVARVKPRTVKMPPGMGGPGMPPAGTPIKSEAVVTSVTVGADGAYYIGELRGFPGNTGKSQIWRIRPGARNAVCDPARPHRGACKRYVDGLTSIVGLAAGRGGSIYALELSKAGWMAAESDAPPPGALIRIGHDKMVRRELARGKLVLPGGVDVGPGGAVFVAGPIFGPGSVRRVR